jgi:hypothetical protein
LCFTGNSQKAYYKKTKTSNCEISGSLSGADAGYVAWQTAIAVSKVVAVYISREVQETRTIVEMEKSVIRNVGNYLKAHAK